MTLPLWCSPTSGPGDDNRRARAYVSLLSDTDSIEVANRTSKLLDTQILARLHAGDDRAFEMLYRQYVPSLLDFAERYVSADVAEDIVQSVLAAIWHRRTTFEVRGTLAAYLFGAIHREVLYRQRHLSVVREAEGRDGYTTIPISQPTAPDDNASLEELRAALRDAVAALPSRTREVLTLRWVDELRYDEIADVLGISISAAKMHVHRAQPIVRPLLERFRDL